jgi:hypothetical protein
VVASDEVVEGVRLISFSGANEVREIFEDSASIVFHTEPTAEADDFVIFGAGDFSSAGDSEVAFFNRGTAELVMLSNDLARVSRFGRRGEGPGEFLRVLDTAICRRTGQLLVVETNRTHWLTRDGTNWAGGAVTFDSISTWVRPPRTEFVGLDPDCRSIYRVQGVPESGEGYALDSVFSVGPDGGHMKLALPGLDSREGRAFLFAKSPEVGVLRSGLAYLREDSARVEVYGWDGALEQSIRWHGVPTEVSGAEWRRAGGITEPAGSGRPSVRPFASEMLADPGCSCLMVRAWSLPQSDRPGRREPPERWFWLWVGESESPSIVELEFPLSLVPVLPTDLGIWAVGEDEFGVESIYFFEMK